MVNARAARVGFALIAGLVVPGMSAADEIHLTNGSVIEVEAWQDVGDAIEFARGGGIIRIAKAEIRRIDGKPSAAGLRMYSAPPSAGSSTATLDGPAATKEMMDLLKQGEGLFAQAVLSAAEKAGAFRRLGEKWRALAVPEALREAHDRGQQSFQIAAEAFTAEGQGTAPDVKERIEAARKGIQDAQGEVRKAGGEPS